MRHLESFPEAEQAFVTGNHTALKQLGFTPPDMLSLATQSHDSREFVISSGHQLAPFTPSQINSCALLPKAQRDFLAQHCAHMAQSGLQHHEILKLSNAPSKQYPFFIRHWNTLVNLPLHTEAMLGFANMPEHTRDLLILNAGVLKLRQFSTNDWARITGFNEHQCYRLIREASSAHGRSNDEFLYGISADAKSNPRPGNLDWLDETSLAAIRRWSKQENNFSQKMAQISQFCRDVFPATVFKRLHEDPATKPLGTLFAGLVFPAAHQDNQAQTVQRAKQALEYLEAKNDPVLWDDCQAQAKDAIEACGDRVDYGFGRLTQVIERHRMTLGELPPIEHLRNLLRHFNQDLVEVAAQIIALEKNVASESVEVYLSLASQLNRQGVDLGDLPDKGLYTENEKFRVPASWVTQVRKQIEHHVQTRSPEFRAAFETDLAAQSALRGMFPADYQKMLDERSKREDDASEMLLAPASSDAQRQAARQVLEQLGSTEPDWYSKKAQEMLTPRAV